VELEGGARHDAALRTVPGVIGLQPRDYREDSQAPKAGCLNQPLVIEATR
jgi:hypothetical protein